MAKTPKELYEFEIRQSEFDHKNPTAGAMSGHVIANLQIMIQKVQQVKWYYTGEDKINLSSKLFDIIIQLIKYKDQLGEVLLDNLEMVPSVSESFSKYSMIEESGEKKYYSTQQMFKEIASDFETNNMFITRAIKLAEKEDLVTLKETLVQILAYSKHQLRLIKNSLGKNIYDLIKESEEEE